MLVISWRRRQAKPFLPVASGFFRQSDLRQEKKNLFLAPQMRPRAATWAALAPLSGQVGQNSLLALQAQLVPTSETHLSLLAKMQCALVCDAFCGFSKTRIKREQKQAALRRPSVHNVGLRHSTIITSKVLSKRHTFCALPSFSCARKN